MLLYSIVALLLAIWVTCTVAVFPGVFSPADAVAQSRSSATPVIIVGADLGFNRGVPVKIVP